MFKIKNISAVIHFLLSLFLGGGIIALFTKEPNPYNWPDFCKPLYIVISLLLFSYIHCSKGHYLTEKLEELGKKRKK